MAVIEHPQHETTRDELAPGDVFVGAPHVGIAGTDERAARDDLRAQIKRLERQLAHLAAATYPRLDMSPITPGMTRGPRVLGLGDLERVRDALADRLTTLRTAALVQAEEQAEAREELERMIADPRAYRGRRMSNAEIGLPGCTVYEVVPRLGPLGRLASWWQVKVSSGCPLVWGA